MFIKAIKYSDMLVNSASFLFICLIHGDRPRPLLTVNSDDRPMQRQGGQALPPVEKLAPLGARA